MQSGALRLRGARKAASLCSKERQALSVAECKRGLVSCPLFAGLTKVLAVDVDPIYNSAHAVN